MLRTRRLATWVDRRLALMVVRSRSPRSDRLMTQASLLANRSKLWLAVAAGLALTGRRRPRMAAASGLLGVGSASALVNGPLKFF